MLEYLFAAWSRLVGEEKGQTAVEYGLVVLLVALVVAGILVTGMTEVLNEITTALKAAV